MVIWCRLSSVNVDTIGQPGTDFQGTDKSKEDVQRPDKPQDLDLVPKELSQRFDTTNAL